MNTIDPCTCLAFASRRSTIRGRLARVVWVLLPGIVALGLLVGACAREPIGDGLPKSTTCKSCHGSADGPAPPKGIDGRTETSAIGVGAHATHMQGTSSAGSVACVECHPVPGDTDTPDHPNLVTDVVFGPVASSSGAAPTWDRATATCNGTYCHGVTLRGSDSRTAPVWTVVDTSQRRCTSCHQDPPEDGSHGAHSFMACGGCHAPVLDLQDHFEQPELHVDGELQVSMPTGGTWDAAGKTCASTGTSCHGSEPYPW